MVVVSRALNKHAQMHAVHHKHEAGCSGSSCYLPIAEPIAGRGNMKCYDQPVIKLKRLLSGFVPEQLLAQESSGRPAKQSHHMKGSFTHTRPSLSCSVFVVGVRKKHSRVNGHEVDKKITEHRVAQDN